MLILLAGCGGKSAGDSASSQTAEKIAVSYHTRTLMTKEPVYVDPTFAGMCRMAWDEEVAASRKEFGPHTNTAIYVSMNSLAATAFEDATYPYPVGSVIVKNKLGSAYEETSLEPSKSLDGVRVQHPPSKDSEAPWEIIIDPHHFEVKTTPDGVGGMIKRALGYDPEHGDWEYFFYEDPAKIDSGKLGNCIDCHQNASARDYVFGSWAEPRP